MANRVKLDIEDIEPLEKAIEKYTSMGSGLVWYKGEGWDWRMAKNALDDLKTAKEAKIEGKKSGAASPKAKRPQTPDRNQTSTEC